MLRAISRAALAAVVSLTLVSCAGYVDNFASRIDNGDEAYNRSIANGVLRNIIRAGYDEPTSFVGLGKYTGTSNSNLSGAIPGFSLNKDPLQIAVTGFSGKEDTNAQIEATVLATSGFVGGMLSPIDLRTFRTFLDQRYSRELLLYLFVDNFRVIDTTTGEVSIFRNDPTLDDASCTRHDYSDYANRAFQNKHVQAEYGPFRPGSDCEFHRFQFWVEESMLYGFGIDFPTNAEMGASSASGAAPARKGAAPAASGASAKPGQDGRVCYDLGLVSPDTSRHLREYNRSFGADNRAESPICGSRPTALPSGGTALGPPILFAAGDKEKRVRVSFDLRSPAAMFRYVGRLAVSGAYQDIELFERSAVTPTDHRLLAIDQARSNYCYAVTLHHGLPFCIPQDSPNTKAAVAILANLVQLKTDRSDLPTNTTTVNISP